MFSKPMKVQTFKGGYDSNFAYLVTEEEKALLIDPSVNASFILNYVKENNLKLTGVVVMHSHFDHTTDLDVYRENNIPLYAHESTELEVDKKVKEGDVISLDKVSFKVMHTPGHIYDSICLFGQGMVFTSDTLFVHACGRVDFPGSDPKKMMESLNRLKELPEDTVVYPGHDYGPMPRSTIKEEKINNPFLE